MNYEVKKILMNFFFKPGESTAKVVASKLGYTEFRIQEALMARDARGQVLNEGDEVSFSLGLGQTVVGRVARADSVLAGPQAQAMVYVSLMFPLPVEPNGMVAGILKLAKPGE